MPNWGLVLKGEFIKPPKDEPKGEPNGESNGEPAFEPNEEPKIEPKGELKGEPNGESSGELNGIELPKPPKLPNGLKELNGEENGLLKSVKQPIIPGPVPPKIGGVEGAQLNGLSKEQPNEPPLGIGWPN